MPGTKDDVIAAFAEGQAATVSGRQLRAAGLSEKDIKVRKRRRTLLDTPARGVYRIAGAERTWRQDLWIAILAGPEGTLASHLSAAALKGLLAPPAVPHVTVPRGASGRFGGAVVHHGDIDSVDRCRNDGIEATAAGRTLADCAAVLDQKTLNELVDTAFSKRLCSHVDALDAWRRAGPLRGGTRLAAALAPYDSGAAPGSIAAARILRRINDWGLPRPVTEYEIRDGRGEWVATVDFAWPAWRLVLEYDGEAFHGPRRWALDDRRQALIEALGWRVLRADRYDLRPSSTRLFELLSAILGEPACA
jgi:hypothetical protein